MGGSDSKPEAGKSQDNTGMLNGNIINNGNIVEQIEKDLNSENYLLKIVIAVKIVHILIILAKWAIKTVRRQENRNRAIEHMMVEQNRQA